ncbi:UBX domain-containing protein 4 [Trichonephila clavipes]|uniref:UBX domain-containing protein 4 n=1 Tax=Trichonephila clavipes TaxID=2585209 RepID=A0A8X6WHF1_TRICX|nr:UBX domain-containing protein 4 [Trichonephila clavipes]
MNWYNGSIPEAVAEAKRNNKLFLVYIEGNDEMSKQMTDTYNNPAVAEKLSHDSIVALKLIANSVPYMQFCAIYPVLVIPSSFFIGGNGAPIEIITGSLAPAEFSKKLEKLLETYEASFQMKKESQVNSTSSSSSKEPEVSIPSGSQNENSESEPSTSQTATAAESLQEKIERAKVLVEAQKHQKAQQEKEKEKEDEIKRRNMGKAIQQAQQTRQDNELKEWAKNRAKEKEEERLAREKVKAMIAQDRAERAAKYQQVKDAEQAEKERLIRNREASERAMRNAALSSNDARIQFRLPDGSFTTHCFSADASLEEARRFVIEVVRPPFSSFSLCTTFPRRHFSESNYSESLRDLQLAPSAVLLILPERAVTNVSPGTSFISSLFWTLLSPLTTVWNFIRSFFPGSTPQPSHSTRSQSPSDTQEAASTTANNLNNNTRQRNQGQKESPFAKREGNIFRINNQSDDDENNTWNGNSTQQM